MNPKFVFSTLVIAGLLVGGCAGGNRPAPPTPAASTGAPEHKMLTDAIASLNAGKAADARERLVKLLKKQPGHAIAASLLRQIDTPPQTLLGATSFAYTTRAGDTMSALAGRFLGDPTLFYALARYNGIAAPETLAAGRALRIPGKERRDPPPPARSETPRERVPSPKTTAPAPAPAAPPVNPAQASRLRAAGLEQMNRGAIDRAVVLLGQATRLDPANALIRRDLDRAQRIQRTVRTTK